MIRPRIFLGLAFRRLVHEPDMRVGDGRLLQPFVDRRPAFLVFAFDLQRDLRPLRLVPFNLLVLMDQGLVLFRIDLDFEKMGGRSWAGPRDDLHRLAGRQLSIHAGRRDTDALLAAAHPHAVKFRAIEQLGKNPWNLLTNDARPVVRDGDPEFCGLAGRDRFAVRDHLEPDGDVRQNAGFFTSIERIVHGFLYAGEQSLARIIEPEQMPVLREEFRDGNFPLARTHLHRSDLLLRRFLLDG